MEYIDGEKSSNSFTTGVFPLSSTSEVEFEGIKNTCALGHMAPSQGKT